AVRYLLLCGIGAPAGIPRPGRRPCLLRRARGSCPPSRTALVGLLPGGAARRRSPEARRLPAARCVLAETRLCTHGGCHRGIFVEGCGRGGRDREAHAVLDPGALARRGARAAGEEDMKIAAAAYPLDWFESWVDYETKIAAWVAEAAGRGAELLVFPEYGAMELASLGGRAVAGDLEGALREADRHKPASDAMHARLAAHHGVHILSGSGPVYDVAHAGDRPVNRASLFGPDGVIGHQDKVMMTRFEREDWHVV